MRKRSIGYVLVALIVIGVMSLVFLTRTRTYTASSAAQTTLAAKELPSPSRLIPQSASTPIKRQLPGGPYEPADPRWAGWLRKWKEDPSWEGRIPLNFYGKVVDQGGLPVQGAKVRFDWTDLSAQGTSIREATSDGSGLFSLVGEHGKFLEVNVSKEGYYTGREGNRFDFEYASFSDKNYYEPNPNTPVIFHLRKRGTPAQQLVHRQTLYGLTVDGTPHYFDLLAGKKQVGGSPLGDLVVRLNRSAITPQYSYTWSASVEAVNGGVLQSNEEFMFEAPEVGYEQSIQESGDRQSQPPLRFFFKSRNGQIYGHVTMQFEPNYNMGAAVDMDYYVNPSGSRNLEYDSTQQSPTP